ncbi:MAG: DNA polymerase III subunit beta [Spirochaetes bacterium]|nr:DNA polymerase III subunit beta [Spirochaetota bacterium]MBU0954571.1 DNA polymerase III subunit beta [Spirochaetota bacterium]
MKFTCEKNVFHKEIAIAQEVISSRTSISVVSNVYLEASGNTLIIRATDIKIGFETRIPIEIQEEGSITVFCDKLSGILASIPDGILEIEHRDGKLKLKPSFKKANFTVKTISSEQFPELPLMDVSNYFSVPVAEFKEMVAQTVFAVSEDETRYFMNGVYLEKRDDSLIMVATDGRRLSYIKKEITGLPDFKSIIIPPKILNIVQKRAPDEGLLDIAVSDKNIFIKFGMYNLSSVLIEGQFPNYQKVIPESQTYSISVKKSDVLDALKRVSIFVEQKSRRTYFELSDDTIVLSSEESEVGTAREEIVCSYAGPKTILALNYKYVEDPLKVMRDETIRILYTENSRAVTIAPEEDSSYFHILMPMSVDQA